VSLGGGKQLSAHGSSFRNILIYTGDDTPSKNIKDEENLKEFKNSPSFKHI
jgi:hypothetical protein